MLTSTFQPAIDWVRHNVKEIVGTVDCNLVFSLLKLLECFFTPFTPKEVRQGDILGPLLYGENFICRNLKENVFHIAKTEKVLLLLINVWLDLSDSQISCCFCNFVLLIIVFFCRQYFLFIFSLL